MAGITSLIGAMSLAVFSLPLNDASQWQVLERDGIPFNEVHFSSQGMRINVDNSASPIIFPLPSPTAVKKVKVTGVLDGRIKLSKKDRQGAKNRDDFALRIGLVVAGKESLSWVQKRLAPKWVKTLYGLAPEGGGIDHILFLTATQQRHLLGTRRVHPQSNLLVEKYDWHLQYPGEFQFVSVLPEALDVLGVWISSDGDDTASSYSITLTEVILE